MKIAICSSITFNNEIINAKNKLEKLGHEIFIPWATQKILDKKISFNTWMKIKEEKGDLEFRKTAEENLIKRYYKIISEADAIIVLNLDKKGIKNYIGGNTFLEMGFAHVLNKKIFLLNNLPEMAYSDELKEMDAIVLNGDLSKISKC